jgi:hypothetical protein
MHTVYYNMHIFVHIRSKYFLSEANFWAFSPLIIVIFTFISIFTMSNYSILLYILTYLHNVCKQLCNKLFHVGIVNIPFYFVNNLRFSTGIQNRNMILLLVSGDIFNDLHSLEKQAYQLSIQRIDLFSIGF